MELIPVVDENDNIIGEEDLVVVHKKGLLHRECAVFLVNSENEVLLQLRSDNKLWDTSSAGHFSSKESYLDGAIREFSEELGVVVNSHELQEIGYERIDSAEKNNHRFVKIFLLKKDIPMRMFEIDPKELLEVEYYTKEEILTIINDDAKITRTARYLLEKYILPML